MDASQQERLGELFERCVALPPNKRGAMLDELGRRDAALRDELASLLVAHDDAPNHLDHLAGRVFAGSNAREEPADDPLIGRTIDHYEILERLGGGGMGVIYKARDIELHRLVVLKSLPATRLADAEARARLKTEACAASALDHPNIAVVHDIAVIDQNSDDPEAGRAFIAMAYYAGETLEAKIARGPLPVAVALNYAIQTASGLARAHEAGIVHRDIKPANLVITTRDEVKIVDFGIVKMAGVALTRPGVGIGTAAYMSPEQTWGDPVDGRTDIWSLGATLYEMLAGRRPFQADNEQALIYQIRHDPPETFDRVRHDVPPAVEHLVSRCLEKEVAHRFPDADSLHEALVAVRDGIAERPRRADAAPKRKIRWPALAATAVLLVAAVALTFRTFSLPPVESASIAVLPFKSEGPADRAYFADGLTDAVTASLVRVSGLTVIDPRSAVTYKSTSESPAQIGRELRVSYLLEGTVAWVRDDVGEWRAQVRPTLVRARDGAVRWAGDPIVVTPTDPFSAQSEIASKVVSATGVAMDVREQSGLTVGPTKNAAAYEAYFRARSLYRYPPRGMSEAQAIVAAAPWFERATQLDSTFALAFAELAFAEAVRSSTEPAAEPRYQAAIRRALALDPNLPEVHFARAWHLWWREGNFADALAASARASTLRPGDAELLSWLATFQIAMGQTSVGFANIERTIVLDPRDPISNHDAALFSWYFRRLDDARRHAERMIAIWPDDWQGYYWLVLTALARGDTAAARTALGDAARVKEGGIQWPSAFWMLPRSIAESLSILSGHTSLSGFVLGADSLSRYVTLGAWARERHQPEVARVYFDSAISLAQRPKYALNGHGDVIRLVPRAALQAIALAGVGRASEARRLIAFADSLRESINLANDPTSAGAEDHLAYAFLVLGDRDEALRRLERLLVLPSGRTPAMLRTMWPYSTIRDDPRFKSLTQP